MRGAGNVSVGLTNTSTKPGQTPSETASLGASVPGVNTSAKLGVEWVLIVAAVLYFAFVLIFRHEKVRQAIEPKNVEFNLYSSLAIFLQAAFWILIFKVLVTKLAIWTKAAWAKSLALVVGGL